jgi:hypothetical protein
MTVNSIKRPPCLSELQFSNRVECPRHGRTMVLITHRLSDHGARLAGIGVVTFYRCACYWNGHIWCVPSTIAEMERFIGDARCKFMRPNKYQIRAKGERHK